MLLRRGYGQSAMATIGDVAKRAGVSTTLVSRYLNGVKGVSPASKEKIESAIRELNYVPDESARMLVRRRGGTAPAEPAKQASPIPPSIVLLCEDTDPQLMSALYLGAKIALRTDETQKSTVLTLIVIPAGDDRASDEADALAYIQAVSRGVYAVGGSDALREQLASLGLPVLHLTPASDAQRLYRTSGEFRDTLASLERDSGARMLRLCEQMAREEKTVTEEAFAWLLQVSDDPMPDRNPLGRSLQSHLL